MSEQTISNLISALAWPSTVLLLALVFRSRFAHLLFALTRRLEAGAELTTPWISVGAVVKLPSASKEEKITASHIALVHSSWRYAKKDREFKKRMYCFHAIIQGADQVLDRVESVTYYLDPSYPKPKRTVTDRASKFKLKELAYGESMLRAVVTIAGQAETVELTRYINLTESGAEI
jgi:hypothetical protein